jgi:hypothetical protein
MSFSFVGIAIKAPFLDYNDRVCEKNRWMEWKAGWRLNFEINFNLEI